MYKNHSTCRVCGNENLKEYIDLGMLPLSNNLLDSPDDIAERYPLKVLLCEDCGLSQLSIVIDPSTLFSHYVYRSSINEGYRNHCRDMAKQLKAAYGLDADSFHIDIAGNDGALLHEFNQVVGCRVLNIDPAANMVPICEAKGIRQYTAFWGVKAAKHLMNTDWPRADLITATNVFAHVDNVKEFIEAAAMVLKPTGVLILEFPYLIDFVDKGEFDTIYFEHLSYFSIHPITKLCVDTGLKVMRVEKQDIHGGSVRVHIGYGEADDSVRQFVLKEFKYRDITLYYDFAIKAKQVIDEFGYGIAALVSGGHKVAAFAASAKGNTLLNCAGISKEISYIVDETPEKIGKYSPGTGIEIVSIDRLQSDPPDFLIILSWNFAEAIKAKCIEAGYKGEFIVPVCG
jgi:ubiquinone/menaquinone biosynthesis C-methylase UbiE